MALIERVLELQEAGEEDMIRSFVKGVRLNDPVIEVHLFDDHVEIETETFIGTHSRTTTADGHPDIASRGRYEFKDDRVDISFETYTLRDDVVARVRSRLAAVEHDSVGDDQQQSVSASTTDSLDIYADGGAVDPAPVPSNADDERTGGRSLWSFITRLFR